jgi:spore photoproduct lyase
VHGRSVLPRGKDTDDPRVDTGVPTPALERLLDITTIYHEPDLEGYPRAAEILSRYPDAERVEVPSHQNIPGLFGNAGNVRDWVRLKRNVLVLGVKKSLSARPNGRSSDFIAPSISNGCTMACSYCYVPRRKGFANPITTYVNIEKIVGYLERHARRQGLKETPNQCDPVDWVYDIGENGDCSIDAAISRNVRDLVDLFARLPNAKASFATKFVNDELLDYDPRGGTRIRFSMMPEGISKQVDLRTSPIASRVAAVNDFVAAGYEVHLNFSPVIVHEDWLASWARLFEQIDAGLDDASKRQLACEIIFLTHNEDLHQVNLGWHPGGEELLWRPDLQEGKRSQSGQWNVRYKSGVKRGYVNQLTELMAATLPYCRVRYAF